MREIAPAREVGHSERICAENLSIRTVCSILSPQCNKQDAASLSVKTLCAADYAVTVAQGAPSAELALCTHQQGHVIPLWMNRTLAAGWLLDLAEEWSTSRVPLHFPSVLFSCKLNGAFDGSFFHITSPWTPSSIHFRSHSKGPLNIESTPYRT